MRTHDDTKQWYLDAVNQTVDSRKECELDRDYYDNIQHTSEEISELNKRKQPPVTDNRIKPKTDTFIGTEINSRVDIKAFPRNPGDEQSGEAVTDALRYVADNSDFDQTKTDAAYNLCIEGTMAGIVEVEKTPKGFDVMPRHIPWDRFFIDPHSSRKDGKDAKFMGQAIWMDLEDAKELFPKADESLFSSDTDGTNEYGDTYDDKPKDLFFDNKRQRVKVIEMYYHSKGWKHTMFTGLGDLVPERDSPYLDEDGVPVNPIEMQSAFVDRNNNRYGPNRQLRSPQDEINKRKSKALHLFSTRQVIAEEGAVENVNRAKQELAKPDGWITKRPGKQMDIQQTGDMAIGQFNLLQQAIISIDSQGQNSSSMGTDSSIPSGRAQQVRIQAGNTENTPILDGLRSWETRMYRQMWMRVRQFWTEQKWVRITDDESNIKFVGLNRPVTMKEVFEQRGTPYDVNDPRLNQVVSIENPVGELDVDIILEAVPDTVSIQAEQFEVLASRPDVPLEVLLEFSNVRHKAKMLEKLKGGDPQAAAAKQKAAQEAYQLEKQDKVADIKKKQASAEKDIAQAGKYKVEAAREMHTPL